MLKNYLTIAWRNFLRNRVFAVINIVGLATGFTCALLIGLYVLDELQFDNFHTEADRIYRITETIQTVNGERYLAFTPAQVGYGATQYLPEVENYTRIAHLGRFTMGYQDFRSYEPVYFADSTFFRVFGFTFLSGDPVSALTEPYSVVLTESTAKKYFGDEPPLGKTMYTSLFEAKVTGVIRDIPPNSHLQFTALLSEVSGDNSINWWKDWEASDWSSHTFATYLVLQPHAAIQVVTEKLSRLISQHQDDDTFAKSTFALQPLYNIHFQSGHITEELNAYEGDITYVYIFSAVGLLILIIAFINYVNMATAHATKRAKEVGLRKVIGAQKFQLVHQFLSESLILTLMGVAISVTLVQLLLPFFNQLTEKSLQFSLFNIQTLLGLLVLTLMISIIAGSYPAFYLSGFQPTAALKKKVIQKTGFSTRQVLIIVQFALAIVMIASTMVVYRQMQYIQEKDLGYDREQLLVIEINSDALRDENYEAVKNSFGQLAVVRSATASSRVPSEWKGIPKVMTRESESREEELLFIGADEDFLTTFDIDLLKGHNFIGNPTDSSRILLNETAVHLLGLSDPIGKTIEITSAWGDALDIPFRVEVAGVVRDFHMASIREKIAPMIIGYCINPVQNIDYYTLKINPANLAEAISDLEAINQQFDPENPLEYTLLEDKFNELYTNEVKRGQIFGLATGVAIIIACMGLFALASFSTKQRIKEISIRKVLGATISQITILISREFLLLIAIAFLIALPLAWWLSEKWLQEFVYRTSLSAWLFGGVGLMILLVTIVTVGYQTIKAALTNPAKSLRYE